MLLTARWLRLAKGAAERGFATGLAAPNSSLRLRGDSAVDKVTSGSRSIRIGASLVAIATVFAVKAYPSCLAKINQVVMIPTDHKRHGRRGTQPDAVAVAYRGEPPAHRVGCRRAGRACAGLEADVSKGDVKGSMPVGSEL
jgi:hypothetical protein